MKLATTFNKKTVFIGFLLSLILYPTTGFANTIMDINQPKEYNFTTTSYYSPLKDQSKYFRGNYEHEVMLNGLGKVTASGSTVYKGAIAAPRSIPFGTIIEIENYGFTVVEDRGSAIYDDGQIFRLDIWQGYGEESLKKALNWGYRNNKGWIYPTETKNLKYYRFNNNLDIGSEGDDVRNLQEQLKLLGFFDDNITGYYGPITSDAVYKFQLFKNIVPNRDFLGAGRFGPGTRKRMNFMNESLKMLTENKKTALNEYSPQTHYQEVEKEFYTKALDFGDVDYNVYILQQKLHKLNLFNWPRFTYQYGEATKRAVLDFQLKYGVINHANEVGAGRFGPSTRQRLQSIGI